MKHLGFIGFGALLTVVACATPQFKAEEQSCSATWSAKIPPIFQQQLVNRTRTIQVPTGQMTCTYYGYTQQCNQIMRTEYIPYTAVETVDIRAPERNRHIASCTAAACSKKYGNAECKANK